VTRILAISGSLRAASSNTSLVRAAALVAGPGIRVESYRALPSLPPFNPDLDTVPGLPAVRDLRACVGAADALLISTPEYAHGVPGALKNALDWLVGSGELLAMPVAVINVAARATHARAALIEIVSTMSAHVVAEACITLDLAGPSWSEHGISVDPRASGALRDALDVLANAARARRGASGGLDQERQPLHRSDRRE
jgi:NAD(P)H-dependent FMN reductase